MDESVVDRLDGFCVGVLLSVAVVMAEPNGGLLLAMLTPLVWGFSVLARGDIDE